MDERSSEDLLRAVLAKLDAVGGPPPWLAYVTLLMTFLGLCGGAVIWFSSYGELKGRVTGLGNEVADIKAERYAKKEELTELQLVLRDHERLEGHQATLARTDSLDRRVLRLEQGQ